MLVSHLLFSDAFIWHGISFQVMLVGAFLCGNIEQSATSINVTQHSDSSVKADCMLLSR